MQNIDHAKQDCDAFRECLEKFGVKNSEDFYDLSDDPTKEQTVKVFEEVMERLTEAKERPIQTKYLVVFLIIGHGVFKDGSHSIFFNEFDQ